MDRAQLIERFSQRLQQVSQHVSQQASPSRQDMAAMERLIYGELDAAKADLLQAWVQQAKDDSDRPVCPRCQGRMRQKEQSPKTSVCIGGQVTVPRTRWYCPSCRASFFPSGRDDHRRRHGGDAGGRGVGDRGSGDAAVSGGDGSSAS